MIKGVVFDFGRYDDYAFIEDFEALDELVEVPDVFGMASKSDFCVTPQAFAMSFTTC